MIIIINIMSIQLDSSFEGCYLHNILNSILPVVFFTIGLLLFKCFTFNSKSHSKENQKIKEFILKHYQKENEQFFYGTDE